MMSRLFGSSGRGEAATMAGLLERAAALATRTGLTDTDPALVVSLNYFGALALVTGLRPLLAEGSSVVLVSSNSVTCQPGWSAEVAAACLGDDEEKARRLGLRPRARIVASSVAAIRPEIMGLGPIPAIKAVLAK
jgi:hypothetical protein